MRAFQHRRAQPDGIGACPPERNIALAPLAVEEGPGLRPVRHHPLHNATLKQNKPAAGGRGMKITDRSHSMPYVFDAYGTLFDFHAAVSRHHAAAGPDAAAFSELWRQKQIEYTWTHTLAGRYEEFWTLTERALDYCFERFPSVDRVLRYALLGAYLKLDAYPDARTLLAALKARGERTAIVTNGSHVMSASAVDGA